MPQIPTYTRRLLPPVARLPRAPMRNPALGALRGMGSVATQIGDAFSEHLVGLLLVLGGLEVLLCDQALKLLDELAISSVSGQIVILAAEARYLGVSVFCPESVPGRTERR